MILLIVTSLFTTAFKREVVQVFRGHAFKLVDAQGKIRAEIKVLPPEPALNMRDGGESGYVQILSRTDDPTVKLSSKDGREQVTEIK
ncbi:MAG TPA: hypothetical protein VI583_18145 [Cyclobacteriaceae bacterium]|nr:hypothetical protein [Cyclobacteriaceae bacterium]